MKKNLVIAVIGNPNSGKSQTWYTLFGDRVKTGNYERDLQFSSLKEYVKVFLINGSPEERGKSVEAILDEKRPRIVLCSIQYLIGMADTIDFFIDNDYHLFVHWLNPGYNDLNINPQFDNLGLINRIVALGDSNISIKDGKVSEQECVDEIEMFLYGWAKYNDLLITR